jgi:hypothetical protein
VRPEAVDRLKELGAELSRPDPYPEHLGEEEQDAWMDRVGADGDLAGSSARRSTALGSIRQS